MESQTFTETIHIIIPGLVVVIRCVQAYTHIDTQYQETYIISQPDSRTKSNIPPKCFSIERTTGSAFFGFEQPNVSGIEKDCSLQISQNRESQLDIAFEFEITRLVEISIGIAFRRSITSGAYRTYGKSPYTIGSAYIELFAIRQYGRIAVSPTGPNQKTCRQPSLSP